jgi:integrase
MVAPALRAEALGEMTDAAATTERAAIIGERHDRDADEDFRPELAALPSTADCETLVKQSGYRVRLPAGRSMDDRPRAEEQEHNSVKERVRWRIQNIDPNGELGFHRSGKGIAQVDAATMPARRRGRKRAGGEGTISQHATSGQWRGRVMVGRKLDGRPDVREVYAKTQGECRRKLDELRRRLAAGLLGNAKVERDTVAALLAGWLEGKRGTVEETTWERYEYHVRLHLVPALGAVKVAALRPDDLRRLYAAKLGAGLSPRSVEYIHITISQALKQAVQDGDLPRNVAANVKPPKVERKEMRPLAPDEVGRLLAAAREARERARVGRDAGHAAGMETVITLAAHVGCREGELLGLKWQDVDWAAGTVTVQRNLTRARNSAPRLRDPKTRAGLRTLHLTATALAALRAHRQRQLEHRLRLGPDYADDGLVFATYAGGPLMARNVIRAFKALATGAGLPRETRIHDLRHTTATMLLASGTDIATTARILGHASPQITATVYAHVLPRATADAALRLERAFRGAEVVAASE